MHCFLFFNNNNNNNNNDNDNDNNNNNNNNKQLFRKYPKQNFLVSQEKKIIPDRRFLLPHKYINTLYYKLASIKRVCRIFKDLTTI